MPASATGSTRTAVADARHFWERTAAGWHGVFAALVLICVGLAVFDEDASTKAKVSVVVLLALWAGWYVLTWTRFWAGQRSHLGLVYVAGMVPLCLATLAIAPSTSVMLFVAIAQIYASVQRLRYAIAVVVLLFVGFGIALSARGAGSEVFAGLGFSAVFSAVIGAWIGGIIRQSGDRAALISELRDTHAELATVAAERGALAERDRLSRDIHDTVAQGFTSIVMLLEAAEPMIGADEAAVRRHLELARQAARENLAETRSLVAALTPAGLADSTLVDAVRRIADRCAEEAQLTAALSVTGSPRRLAAGSEVVLLRAAQESLANVRKHAGASRVELTLAYAGEETVLRVHDDGCGFEPALVAGSDTAPAYRAGFGLNGMRARVEEAGGSLCVSSRPAGGTTVEVRLP